MGTQKLVDGARDFGHEPIIVLSKVDENIPNIRENPLTLPSDMERKKEELAEALQVDSYNVFHMVNYKNEVYGRNFGIDKLTYMVLRQALKRAGEFIKDVESNCGDYTSQRIYGLHKEKRDNLSLERQPKSTIRTISDSESISLSESKNPQDNYFPFGKSSQKGYHSKDTNQASAKSKEDDSPSGECCSCIRVKKIGKKLGCAEQHVLCQDCAKLHTFESCFICVRSERMGV